MSLPSFLDFGEGLPVICLHGVGSGKEGFSRQREPFGAAGFRFIAVDAPGFGETALQEPENFDAHVEAVISVMDYLNIAKAVFLGHSLGGMTAQEIFARHRDRVTALVLSATSPTFGKADGDFQKQFIASRTKPFDEGMTMPEFAQSFGANLLGPAPENGALSELIETLSAVSIESYLHAMRTLTTFDRRAELATIDVPVLLIAGSHDKNSPAPMMEKMASKISGACFHILAETGHMAPIENSTQFNHHVLKFLKSLTPC